MCCIKAIEILTENKLTCLQALHILRDQRGWVWLGLIADCSQFSTVSLAEFKKNFDSPRFRECGLDIMGLVVFNKNLITNSQITIHK